MFFFPCLTASAGESLSHRLEQAVLQVKDHLRRHQEFTRTFSNDLILKWSAMVDQWNEDPHGSHPDPYQDPESGNSNIHKLDATLLTE